LGGWTDIVPSALFIMPTDAYLKEVPPRLSQVFEGRRKLLDICEALGLLQAEIEYVFTQPYGHRLDCELLSKQFEQLAVSIAAEIPHSQCDCPPSERKCPKCEGRRWLTATQHRQALPVQK